MGASDDGTSVVDTDCKVWGVENLFIGSCGVMETRNACNPTLTAVALGVRASRRILERFKNSK